MSPRDGEISLFFFFIHQKARMADTISATTVVTAEQIIPKPRSPRNTRSREAFNIEENARKSKGVLLSPTLFRPLERELNMKTKGTPRNVIERYQVVLSRMDVGVSIRQRMERERMNPTTATTEPEMIPRTRVVPLSFLSLAISLAPKASLISIPAPIVIPETRRMTIFITGAAIPSAAKASSPIKRPAIMESTALYISCIRFPKSSGTAYFTRWPKGLPFVMSSILTVYLV